MAGKAGHAGVDAISRGESSHGELSRGEFLAMRRRRNWAIFWAIIGLCFVFYAMTIIRVGIGN